MSVVGSPVRSAVSASLASPNAPFGSGSDLAFNMPMTSSITSGLGELAFFAGGDSDSTIIDHKGRMRRCSANEARFYGARRVENLWAGNYSQLGTGLTTRDINSYEFTITGLDNIGNNRGLFNSPTLSLKKGQQLRGSCYIKAGAAADVGKSIQLFTSLTGEPTEAASSTTELTSEWVRVAFPIRTYTSANGLGSTSISISGATTNNPSSVKVRDIQIEDVTGLTNQAPAEHVGYLDGTGPELISDSGLDDEVNGSSWSWVEDTAGAVQVVKIPGALRCTGDGTAANAYNQDLTCKTLVGPDAVKEGRLYVLTIGMDNTSSTLSPFLRWNIYFGSTDASPDVLNIITYFAGLRLLIRPTATTAGQDVLRIGIQLSPATGRTFSFDMTDVSLKEVDYGTDADAVKYFDYDNGNSVNADNTITEVSGAALTTVAGVLPEQADTNEIEYSYDFNNAYWTKANAGPSTSYLTETGISGATQASVLDDNAGAAWAVWQRSAITIANLEFLYGSAFIKKDSTAATTRFPALLLSATGGTTGVEILAGLDTSTGDVSFTTTGGPISTFAYSEDAGDFWRLVVGMRNNSTGNTSLAYRLYPAYGANADLITGNSATTGSITAEGAMLTRGNLDVHPTTYIETNGATVTKDADQLRYSVPDKLKTNVSEVSMLCDFTPRVDSTPSYFFALTEDNTATTADQLYLGITSGQKAIYNVRDDVDGSDITTSTGSYNLGQVNKMGLSWLAFSLLDSWLNGIKKTSTGNSVDVTIDFNGADSYIEIGAKDQIAGTVLYSNVPVKNLQLWSTKLADAIMQEKTT